LATVPGTSIHRLGCISRGFQTRSLPGLVAFTLTVAYGTVPAVCEEWRKFIIPSTGASAEIPISVFIEEAELPDGGIGRRFYTDDRRADLTVQSVANPANDSPATFLAKKNSPAGIVYKRVTPSFFNDVQERTAGRRVKYKRWKMRALRLTAPAPSHQAGAVFHFRFSR
jgi:hypothetical protein